MKSSVRLAKFPQLENVKLFISEWNMDLMRPNLAPGFQPGFVLETMRHYAEAGLDMAAYYHIRDCFVDPADFDWMSPGGRRFMAHWWNTMPQYSALFDHHGRVRPAWYAFRLLGQLEGPRYAVPGEQGGIRAIAGDGDGYKHLIVWRYEGGGPDEIEVRLTLSFATEGEKMEKPLIFGLSRSKVFTTAGPGSPQRRRALCLGSEASRARPAAPAATVT
jgi:hypothetical protein